jgi:putative addiction module component (TIGR02574 family)
MGSRTHGAPLARETLQRRDPLGGFAGAADRGRRAWYARAAMTTRELLQEALRLPPEARAALAAQLIESLEGLESDEDVEAAWSGAIRQRLDEVDSGLVDAIPWEQARQRIVAAARRDPR